VSGSTTNNITFTVPGTAAVGTTALRVFIVTITRLHQQILVPTRALVKLRIIGSVSQGQPVQVLRLPALRRQLLQQFVLMLHLSLILADIQAEYQELLSSGRFQQMAGLHIIMYPAVPEQRRLRIPLPHWQM